MTARGCSTCAAMPRFSNPAYEELTPWRWGELPFDEGRFPMPDGKARLLPLS